MDNREIHQKAEGLFALAEQGARTPLSQELDKINPKERLALVREMVKLGDEHHSRKASGLPDVLVEVVPRGDRELTSIDIKLAAPNPWYDPSRFLGASERKISQLYSADIPFDDRQGIASTQSVGWRYSNYRGEEGPEMRYGKDYGKK